MPDRPILPPLRRTAADAERFARAVHADQRDKAGRPYVEHLERVAKRAVAYAVERGLDADEVAQIAWLHDTIEDAGVTGASLLLRGYSPHVIGCIGWLTKLDDEPYGEWIASLCARAPLASLIVKLADMQDNADPARLALLPEDVRARLTRKYAGPLERLRAAVERRAGHSKE